jgi:hypothetical protein
LKIRLIPKLLSERSEMFRFYSCRFRIERDAYKDNCARMMIARQFNIANCFTLECSSFGYISKKEQRTVQFKEADLIEFGKSLAECVLEYQLLMERDAKIRAKIVDRMKTRKDKNLNDQMKIRQQQLAYPLSKHGQVKRSVTTVSMKKDAGEAVAEINAAQVLSEAGANGLQAQSKIESGESVEEYDGEEDEEDIAEDDKGGESKLNAGKEGDTPIIEEEDYSFGSPRKKLDDGGSEIIVRPLEKPKSHYATIKEEDRFYSDDEDNEDSPNKRPRDNNDEESYDLYEEERGEILRTEGTESEDYELSPVTRPSDIKGLLKIKQKKSKLDLKLY